MRTITKLVWLLLLVMVGCEAETVEPQKMQAIPASKSNAFETTTSISPRDSFRFEIPPGSGFEILQEGEIGGNSKSYMIALSKPDSADRFVVTVLPSIESHTSVESMASEWEIGLLEKMSRKISSKFTNLNGKKAYNVVAQVDAEGHAYTIDTYLLTNKTWNFTLGISTPGNLDELDQDMVKLRDSFSLVGP
ncbi:MAG: hypothetical protein ACKVT0_23270 [Planctomycetaceae bacterium]